MDASRAQSIEKLIERSAAALLGVASAYAAYQLLGATPVQPALAAQAGGVGAFAYLFGIRAQRWVRPQARKHKVAIFDVRELEPAELSELLLTDVYVAEAAVDEPLVLDDVLAELEPGSRVVRLFDPASMPTAGQLDARIQRHLDGQGRRGPPDASQALHDALADLRRSLG